MINIFFSMFWKVETQIQKVKLLKKMKLQQCLHWFLLHVSGFFLKASSHMWLNFEVISFMHSALRLRALQDLKIRLLEITISANDCCFI